MYYFAILFLLICEPSLSIETLSPLLIGEGQSTTLHVNGITRVALSSSKIAKVKTVHPDLVIVSGIKVGEATLHVWKKIKGASLEEKYFIKVVASEAYERWKFHPTEQIIHATLELFELDSSLGNELGIRWPSAVSIVGTGNFQSNLATTGLNFVAGFGSTQGFINHLVQAGWASMVAKPELYVRVGETASFHSGGEFPVFQSEENYGKLNRKVEWKSHGITIKIKPSTFDYYQISSDISVEVSEIKNDRDRDVPSLTKRSIDTKMESVSGETVVLTGLTKRLRSAAEEGLPGLIQIPIIGNLLFGSRKKEERNTELIMAITLAVATRRDHNNGLDRLKKPLPESLNE